MRTSFIYYPSLKFLLLVPKYRHQKIDIVTRILKLQLRLYPLFVVLVKLLGTQVNYRIGHPQKTVAELFHVLPERLVKG